MAKFLNTDLLNQWIPRLIEESERELVIIVPYIKTSERIYSHLKAADKRGVETTLIYRENQLSPAEKQKLMQLGNINLMHHPNVHAKCYYNEKYMIIGSMNLYEYSERNNREMGVLLHKGVLETDENNWDSSPDADSIFQDAIQEIKQIVSAAHIEKQSRETKLEGFEMEIIKTNQEKEEDFCRSINKIFLNKKFVPVNEGGQWESICKNYFDKIDVVLNYRIEIVFNREDAWFNQLHQRATDSTGEFMFPGFKFYWLPRHKMVTLYVNGKHHLSNYQSHEQEWKRKKEAIDKVISHLRQFI